jgi:hypothetical protein
MAAAPAYSARNGRPTVVITDPNDLEAAAHARFDMLDEGRRIVDAARERGVVVRLLGGLAVRTHCSVIAFCERDYSDLDMVGLVRQSRDLIAVFETLGYEFNVHALRATGGGQLQFTRPCRHEAGDRALHEDDHVDVFLDTFRMDHEIALKDRLELDDYTVSVTDQLLTKLQIHRPEEKDVRDVLTLLKDLALAEEEGPGVIGLRRLARLCARDWGLFHDVERNLDRCAALLDGYGLSAEEEGRILDGLAGIDRAIEAEPKSIRWRLRARIGERRPWFTEVEEQG